MIKFEGAIPGFNPGSGLTGARNGLSVSGSDVLLGGELDMSTVIDTAGFSFAFETDPGGATNRAYRFTSAGFQIHQNGTGQVNLFRIGNSSGFTNFANIGDGNLTGLQLNVTDAINGLVVNNAIRFQYNYSEGNIRAIITPGTITGSDGYSGYGVRLPGFGQPVSGLFVNSILTSLPMRLIGTQGGIDLEEPSGTLLRLSLGFDYARFSVQGQFENHNTIIFEAGSSNRAMGLGGSVTEFIPSGLIPHFPAPETDYLQITINGATYNIPCHLA